MTTWKDPSPDGRTTFRQEYSRLTVNPVRRRGMGYPPFLRFHSGVVIDGRRGPIGKPDTERGRAKYLHSRALQGKDRR